MGKDFNILRTSDGTLLSCKYGITMVSRFLMITQSAVLMHQGCIQRLRHSICLLRWPWQMDLERCTPAITMLSLNYVKYSATKLWVCLSLDLINNCHLY